MKKILGLIGCMLLSFILWATLSAGIENIKIEFIIKDFIKDAVMSEEESTKNHKVYYVKYDGVLDERTYIKSGDKYFPGGRGDILCTKVTGTSLPVVKQGIEYYVGGHAAICGFDYQDYDLDVDIYDNLETTGMGLDDKAKPYRKTTWFNSSYYEIMGFRVKTDLENRFKAFNRAVSFMGQPYNFSFIFNLNSTKYCSDLVSQSYDYVGIDLDYDGLATTVLDIMVSNKVYMTYYSRVDNNGVRYTYLLV